MVELLEFVIHQTESYLSICLFACNFHIDLKVLALEKLLNIIAVIFSGEFFL